MRNGLASALSPQTASVILGAVCGFLAIEWSHAGLPGGILYLLAGYGLGAAAGAGLVLLLGAVVGQWWRQP